MLYRAESPRELVEAEEALWDAALVKLARHFGVAFQPTIGIMHQPQPPATLARLAEAVAGDDLLATTALVSITSLTGSGLLAIGLRHELFTPDHVWARRMSTRTTTCASGAKSMMPRRGRKKRRGEVRCGRHGAEPGHPLRRPNNKYPEGEEMHIDLSGKIAIVTGGGRGIGREIAVRWPRRASP